MHLLRSVRTYIFAALLMAAPAAAFAGIGVSITIAPPALPVYTQPVCPGDGYIWTPGYWAYGPAGYYWVRGAWVLAPQPGLLWTPGYWGFDGGIYAWHAGYWGPHVGFYGGVHYGFGYDGVGFVGGRWDNGHFFYNTAVSHVNVNVIHNVYHTTIVERPVNRVSFNGRGGIDARPTADQQRWDHEQHFQRTQAQVQREHVASTHHENFASENHGRPPAPVRRPVTQQHNVPRPPQNAHNNMQMQREHNTNVPRPPNGGGIHNAPNNGHNEPAHNAAPHNAPQHNEPHNGGEHGGGGDHHDNKDHR
jgi:hypothetical protein